MYETMRGTNFVIEIKKKISKILEFLKEITVLM